MGNCATPLGRFPLDLSMSCLPSYYSVLPTAEGTQSPSKCRMVSSIAWKLCHAFYSCTVICPDTAFLSIAPLKERVFLFLSAVAFSVGLVWLALVSVVCFTSALLDGSEGRVFEQFSDAFFELLRSDYLKYFLRSSPFPCLPG